MHKRNIFTIVELLVVISIISILASILLPALKNARDSVKKVHCLGNLKQLGTMQNYYAGDYGNYFPAPYRTEFGNYWSNILYTLYIKDKDITPTGTSWGGGTYPEYYNYIGYSSQGCRGEKGTVFNCIAQNGALMDQAGQRRKYSVSYGMSTDLCSTPGTTDGKDTEGKAQVKISYPAEAMLVMDTGIAYGIFINSYQYSDWEPYPIFDNTVHQGGRNVLYCDGHVSWHLNRDIPSYATGNKSRFWTGTD